MRRKWTSKQKWKQHENKKYLWINDTDDIHVMRFTCDEDNFVKCLWIKLFHDGQYVSNYFVYDAHEINMHPLDHAINIANEFKEQQKTQKEPNGPAS